MLRKVRDFWREWWPFLSGAPVAIYTAFAYFSGARNDIFLAARLFRWEIGLLLAVVAYVALVRLLTAGDSLWRPSNAFRVATAGLRAVAAPATPGPQRVASAVLAIAGLGFAIALGHSLFSTYAFVRVQYGHVDRQALVAQAGEVEISQDLPRAIALYKTVLERFPYNRFNNDLEAKIASLEAREAGWRRVANSVREFDARYPVGRATTGFDQLAEACRYISNTAPCTRTEDYLRDVRQLVERADAPGATCRSVVSASSPQLAWVFLDPNDSRWLEIAAGNADQICATLGLVSGSDVATYLDQRWYLSTMAELTGGAV
jgi:hypothetical protein